MSFVIVAKVCMCLNKYPLCVGGEKGAVIKVAIKYFDYTSDNVFCSVIIFNVYGNSKA